NGLFTDQRWIDLVPAFFEGVCILRTSRLNVAPWNLTTRELTGTAPNEVLVNGEPLGFYHFTGFDSGAHIIMFKKNATGNNTVAGLVDWYTQTTASLSKDPLSQVLWHYGIYSDGSKISPAERMIYRERIDLQAQFKNPYDVEQPSYKTWWKIKAGLEYPNLLSPTENKDEMARLRRVLSPGFQAGVSQTKMSLGLLSAHLRQALFDADHRRRLSKRAWEILANEGVPGIVKRLSK
ncbi:MAG: glycosyl transferase, partial [Undibacterium sp.]|nr:glycosyl transferase [Undibacterium sp.]